MESVLSESIKVLSFIVNVATGLAHPLDESRAKELFVALYHHGIPFDYGVVYAMASQNGWKDRHAEQLARLAGRISGGERVRIAHPRDWGEPLVQRLLDEVNAPK